ncbi:MAG TPA: MFS transporter [Rhizobiales bacterium]|nr:MFS transporter [Hyphomicrobiales bacterium]
MVDRFQRLAAIAALLVTGVFAGAQFGKIAPLVGWYRDEIGFSLTLVGWLTSAIGIFVALLALPAGWAVGAFGVRPSFVWSSAVLVAGGVAFAAFDAPGLILAGRLVEGAGYLVLVIAIPAILTTVSPPAWRGAALALWGGFVPLGFAAADFLAAALVDSAGPALYLLANVAIFAALAAISALLLGRVGDVVADRVPTADGVERRAMAGSLSTPVVSAALAFGVYVVLSVGFFAFMPAFAAERGDLLVSAGVIALFVPAGNMLASLFMRRGSALLAARLAAAGFAASAITAVTAFAASNAATATVAGLVFAVAGGVTASAIFAAVPYIVPKGGSVAVAIGLIAQTGGLGTVFGPPLAGHVIERYGWDGYAWFLAAVAVAGAVLVAPLLMTPARRFT